MTRFFLFLFCSLLAAGEASAQAYKCVDARGKVTYTSEPCEKLGQQGDTVRNRMNTAPAQRVAPYAPPPPAAPPPAPATSPSEAAAPPDKPKAEDGGGQGDRRCFTTKSGTRCNETPKE